MECQRFGATFEMKGPPLIHHDLIVIVRARSENVYAFMCVCEIVYGLFFLFKSSQTPENVHGVIWRQISHMIVAQSSACSRFQNV